MIPSGAAPICLINGTHQLQLVFLELLHSPHKLPQIPAIKRTRNLRLELVCLRG
jgi:hypothetical protein